MIPGLTFMYEELNGKNVKYVLLTHGHFDHIGYALECAQKYEAQIDEALHRNIFNVGESGLAGAKYIYSQIVKRQSEDKNSAK